MGWSDGFSAHARASSPIFASILCLSGCDLGAGLQDLTGTLGDDIPGRFEKGGRQIAKGDFSHVTGVSTADNGIRLAAFTTGQDPQLRFIDYLGDFECDGGPAIDLAQFRLVENDNEVIATWTEENKEGWRDYHFINSDCKEVMPPIRNTAQQGFTSLEGIYAWPFLSKNKNLTVLDIFTQSTLLEVEDVVTFLNLRFTYWVLTSDGDLRSYFVDELDKPELHGEDVRAFALGDLRGELYIETSEGVLFRGYDETEFLYEGACLDHNLRGTGYRQILVNPCDSNNRYLVLPGEGREPVPLLLPSSLGQVVNTRYLSGAFLLQEAESDGEGSRYHRVLNPVLEETAEPGDEIELELVGEHVQWLNLELEGRATLLSDYVDGRGKLRHVEGLVPEDELSSTTMSSNVVWADSDFCEGFLAVVQKKGAQSDLVCLDKWDSEASSSSDVFSLGRMVDYPGHFLEPGPDVEEFMERNFVALSGGERFMRTGLLAVVSDVDGGESSLDFLVLKNNKVVERQSAIAKGVLPWSARPISSPQGALYLSGDGKSSLRAALTDSGLDMKIADSVSWFEAIEYPSAGVLYIVNDGKDAGLWFSQSL